MEVGWEIVEELAGGSHSHHLTNLPTIPPHTFTGHTDSLSILSCSMCTIARPLLLYNVTNLCLTIVLKGKMMICVACVMV